MKALVSFRDIGMMDYKEAWDYQEQLFASITAVKIANRDQSPDATILPPNYLLFCEHPHVFTLGKSGDEKNLVASSGTLTERAASFYKINRGGDITYHGPGQLVGYPLLDLDQFFTDIHRYLRSIEEVIILTLNDFGIKGERSPGYTGVWISPGDPLLARKICAIGVRTSRWVTMHGWALNVNTDLSYFDHIIPCGIANKAVTSMNKELGKHVEQEEVKASIRTHFASVFNCDLKLSRDPAL